MASHYTESRQFLIHSVTIENYRGIKSAHLELGKVNVLVGVNGSGKTSILQAIVSHLGLFLEPLNRTLPTSTKPHPDDFHRDETVISVQTAFRNSGEIQPLHISSATFTLLQDASVGSDVEYDESNAEVKVFSTFPFFHTWPSLIKSDEIDRDRLVNLDLFALYPVRRFVGSMGLRSDSFSAPYNQRLSGYLGALEGNTDFASFLNWFRLEEDIENEMRLTKDSNFRNRQLVAVRRAVELALEGYESLRIQRSPRLAMVMLKKGDSTSLEQMSDGEKAIITLVGDIARRACILNPHLENPLESPGMVMVDEIEQHLHPQWQRKIVRILPRVFPNIQFIFTTHSPIVCNSVGPDQLLVIKDGEIKSATAYGWSTKDVLREIFEIDERPPEIEQKLTELDKAIDDANLDEAKKLVKELESSLHSQDSELVRANVLIPMLEMEAADERS